MKLPSISNIDTAEKYRQQIQTLLFEKNFLYTIVFNYCPKNGLKISTLYSIEEWRREWNKIFLSAKEQMLEGK